VLRWAPVLVAALALAPARAESGVPKALAGVELPDDVLAVALEDGPRRLAGRRVIAFSMLREHTLDLAVVDATTKAYLVQVALRGDDAEGMPYRYTPRWRDRNGDDVPELVLTRSDDDAHVPAERVWALRYGALVEVAPAAAGCARAADDDVALGSSASESQARDAAARLVAALDDGDATKVVLCAYGDAVAAAGLRDAPVPAAGESPAIAPIAHDCPGIAWALRHGRALTPTRTVTFASADDHLARVQIAGGAAEVRTPLARHAWVERWVLDERVIVFAELRTVPRKVVVYDPSSDEIVAIENLAEGEVARVVHATDGRVGRFELTVADARRRARTVWTRSAATWRP
jgi:hypothetical protein